MATNPDTDSVSRGLPIGEPKELQHASAMEMPSETMQSTNAHYYPWFDWLRIALACIVMLSHDNGLLDGWGHSGNFAVQIFFALSGWLIGGILLNTKRRDLPRFYFNRALRIWCPYYLALGILLALALTRDHLTAKWAEFVFYKLMFVYNVFGPAQLLHHMQEMPLSGTGSHLWSVNAEEQFYLLAPLLLVVIPARYGRQMTVWVAIALLAWATETYASIVLGVLAAVAAKRFGPFQLNSTFRVTSALVAAAMGACMALGMRYELVAPICSIAIVLALASPGYQHPWGAIAGGMSYSLYLNHWIGLFLFHGVFKHLGLLTQHPLAALLNHLLSWGFDLGLAALLYLHFDRPILASRSRVYTPKRGRVVLVTAYAMVAIGLCLGAYLYSINGDWTRR